MKECRVKMFFGKVTAYQTKPFCMAFVFLIVLVFFIGHYCAGVSNKLCLLSFLAHPSRRLIWLAYRIGRPPLSIARRQHSLNIFSSETTEQTEAKFHMESPWDGGTKVCSNGPGHMTKIAAMPIYDRNLKKSLLLQNQKADDLETWNAALGA